MNKKEERKKILILAFAAKAMLAFSALFAVLTITAFVRTEEWLSWTRIVFPSLAVICIPLSGILLKKVHRILYEEGKIELFKDKMPNW